MAHHHDSSHRLRLALTEVLLVAGIPAFGAFSLVNDGGHSVGRLLAGVEDIIGG